MREPGLGQTDRRIDSGPIRNTVEKGQLEESQPERQAYLGVELGGRFFAVDGQAVVEGQLAGQGAVDHQCGQSPVAFVEVASIQGLGKPLVGMCAVAFYIEEYVEG